MFFNVRKILSEIISLFVFKKFFFRKGKNNEMVGKKKKKKKKEKEKEINLF